MKNIIQKAESYCRTLRGVSAEQKELRIYAKYGSMLGKETCEKIAKEN